MASILLHLLACGADPPAPAPTAGVASVDAAAVPGRKMPPDHDPAAPDLACDTSCHTTPKYPLHLKHEAEPCTTCHLPEDAQAAALRAAAAQAPGTGVRRPHEGALVADQHAARLRLKGKPMPPPPADAAAAPAGMILVPAGEFIMGSNLRWQDESPEYVVDLPAFFIDLHELTNAEYQAFVDATHRAPPQHWKGPRHPPELARHPVTYVDWDDAMAYCDWAGKHLPSEEEWEKAARGTDGRQYPWGDVFSADHSNNPQVESTGTQTVGSYEIGRSPYGLTDMSGNVWEWVDAWYQSHPGNEFPNKEYGTLSKISKGGSWLSCLGYNCGISAPTYNRAFLSIPTKNSSLGLRCAKSVGGRQERP